MEHSAVGESSSEQQIRESADYTCIVRKNWSPSHSGTIDIPPAMDRKHISAPGHILVTRPMMATQSAQCHGRSRTASSVPRST